MLRVRVGFVRAVGDRYSAKRALSGAVGPAFRLAYPLPDHPDVSHAGEIYCMCTSRACLLLIANLRDLDSRVEITVLPDCTLCTVVLWREVAFYRVPFYRRLMRPVDLAEDTPSSDRRLQSTIAHLTRIP